MKRTILMFGLCAFLTGFAFTQTKGSTMYVATKTLDIKSSTGFFASTRGKLAYGDQVTVLQVNGKWVEVRSEGIPSVSGWTTVANLTAKKVIASGAATGTTAKEVALAGKGFNQEVENAYKANGQLNFADVDKTETQSVSLDELEKFLVEGKLSMGDE